MNIKNSVRFVILFTVIMSFSNLIKSQNQEINWVSFEQLEQKMANKPKPILIHVYTPWCGYCKRMAQTTFVDPEIIDFINKNFYAINLNGESKKEIKLNGKTYYFNSEYEKRRNGAHSLLIKLLEDHIVYPSDIILSPEYQKAKVKRGSSISENYIKFLKSYFKEFS